MGMESVERTLQHAEIPPPVREKILLLQQAKSFGETTLGLTPSKSYTYFYEVKNPPLGYNLTASPELELEPYRWCFPIAGCVPYKGFFKKNRAERERDKMAEEGYDIYFRPLVAYSTLGWFPDPIFSTWLRADRAFLVEMLLHEMVHGTIYIKNQSAFNESVATFIGERGTVVFFQGMGNEPDDFFRRLHEKWVNQASFRKEMNLLAERLRALYGSEWEASLKLREKDRLYREAKQAFRDRLSPEQERWFARVLRTDWNNAFLVTHLTYHQDLALWEEVLGRFDGDLQAMVQWLKGLKDEEEPFDRVRAWLRAGPVPNGNVH
jgi:predicted aminopeptidase